jgi:Ca2+/Na+ antiporter
MAFDGVHELATGRYFGRHVGPWVAAVSVAGIDYRKRAATFIFLGVCWLVGSILLLAKSGFSRILLLTTAVLSLFYFAIGTVISLVDIVLLCLPSTKAVLLSGSDRRMS